MLPYGDAWRESRRIFKKHFNSSNHDSVNQPRNILYVRRFLGQLLQRPDDFLQHIRTYVPFTESLVNRTFILFAFLSLVGSTTLSMTYSINVQPYNDPFIAIVEEAGGAASELFIAGAFLVDILPVLKYVPSWFPGAKFQRKAAMMRIHSEKIRNAPFEEAKKLMVFTPRSFLSNSLMTPAQENGDNTPSLVSEALRQMEHSDNPNQDVDLLKDVAAMTYMGESARFICMLSFLLG
jgi:hypothetical protein